MCVDSCPRQWPRPAWRRSSRAWRTFCACWTSALEAGGRHSARLSPVYHRYEATRNEQTLLLLSQKLKIIVPELRQLSLDPVYKTPECAPLLVTLGQGVKVRAPPYVWCTLLTWPGGAWGPPERSAAHKGHNHAKRGRRQRARCCRAHRGAQGAQGEQRARPLPRFSLAAPQGYLKKRGDKGLVRNYKLRYFEQRGEKVMYYKSDRPEDKTQGIGWIDLSKMVTVVREGSAPNICSILKSTFFPGKDCRGQLLRCGDHWPHLPLDGRTAGRSACGRQRRAAQILDRR